MSVRVSSRIPCYGIPPEFCGIFSRNCAGIKLRNSVFFTEFRMYAEFRNTEFRILRNSDFLRNSVFLRNSAGYGIPYCGILYSVDTEFLRNFAGIPYSVSWIQSKKNSAGIFFDGIMDTLVSVHWHTFTTWNYSSCYLNTWYMMWSQNFDFLLEFCLFWCHVIIFLLSKWLINIIIIIYVVIINCKQEGVRGEKAEQGSSTNIRG